MGRESEVLCTNVFLEDEETSLAVRLTNAWIALINQLEQSKALSPQS